MKAWITRDIAPLMTQPTQMCELADEVLFGMPVEVLSLEEGEWYRVRTHYRYESLLHRDDFLPEELCDPRWIEAEKKIIITPYADIHLEPKVQGAFLQGIPRGGWVALLDETKDRWQKVILPNGVEGWTYAENLTDLIELDAIENEQELREALVKTAEMYLGAQYRWGGKTMAGLDCSGLVSIAYLINGYIIYRDAQIKQGFILKEIPKEEIKKGDLMFFPGHVAMYIGDGRYIHSSAGNNGVAYNNLNDEDDYSKGLLNSFRQAASIFG